jgi:hypothetical protein
MLCMSRNNQSTTNTSVKCSYGFYRFLCSVISALTGKLSQREHDNKRCIVLQFAEACLSMSTLLDAEDLYLVHGAAFCCDRSPSLRRVIRSTGKVLEALRIRVQARSRRNVGDISSSSHTDSISFSTTLHSQMLLLAKADMCSFLTILKVKVPAARVMEDAVVDIFDHLLTNLRGDE